MVNQRSETYRGADSGCEFSESCLNCSLEMCVFDEPAGKHSVLKGYRVKEVRRLYSEGKEVKDIVAILKISKRTVQRALYGR